MLAKYFLIIRNYVLSVSSQRKNNFYHQNTLLDAFIGRNPSIVIPLLANQDLTPMLCKLVLKNFGLQKVIFASNVASDKIFLQRLLRSPKPKH